MRLLVTFMLILPVLGRSQSEKDNKFMGFGFEGVVNLLDEPTLSFSEYKSVVGHPEFFLHSDNAELIASDNLFYRNGLRARFIFRGPDAENLGAFKQSRFVTGLLYNSGNNYTFQFSETYRVRADTVTLTSSSGSTETLYRDTIYYNDTEYSARSQNVGLFCEYLIYTGEGMPGLATGIGIATDMTLLYEAQVRQTLNYSTALYDESGIARYTPVVYNPNTDTYSYGNVNYVYGNSNLQKISTAYFIRPYIPIRIEAALSDRPKLSNFTVDINGKIGTEIQINPGASVNARMFYSLGLGLNYYL
ncbi:MAG: hypothetical protein HUJ25_16195 [Crocinitomicaceae bacterium]|nr:hypothetical protein [Crocinitomicaceae bacterium]